MTYKPKVCLIETESHYEVVRNFSLSIYEKTDITIITNDYCKDNLIKLYDLPILLYSYEETPEQVEGVIEDNFDYKLTITPPSFSFFKKHKPWFANSDLLIHNMNYWLCPFRNIYFVRNPSLNNVKSLGRFFKNLPDLLRRRSRYKNTFRSYIAPSKILFENFKNYTKLLTYIELGIQGEKLEDVEKEYYQIVIPGTVNSFRDYHYALRLLKELSARLDKSLKVVLLGCNRLGINPINYQGQTFEIEVFSKPLKEVEYMNYLKSSDLGVLPLKEKVDHRGVMERKGQSNISGGINDLLYVGMGGFLPEFYQIDISTNFFSFSVFRDFSKIQSILKLKSFTIKDNVKVKMWNQSQIQSSILR